MGPDRYSFNAKPALGLAMPRQMPCVCGGAYLCLPCSVPHQLVFVPDKGEYNPRAGLWVTPPLCGGWLEQDVPAVFSRFVCYHQTVRKPR